MRNDPRARCSCASVLEQCHPGDPAPDLCGDLLAGRRSLSGDHPLKLAQHVGGLCVCFRVRRCAPFWPSPARFAAGVGSSISSSASRRCASFWAPSCAPGGCTSGICGRICHAAAALEPLCAFCGVGGSPISPGGIRGLCAIYERSDGGVLDPSPEGSPARPASWPLWFGTGALIRRRRRGSAAIPLRFTAPAGDQAPAHAALEIRSRRDVEAARTVTGREQPFRSGRAPPPGAGLRRSATSEGSRHVATMLGQIQLRR